MKFVAIIAGQEDLPDFADINADHFADTFAEEHETEHESNDSVGEEIEEMEYADLMHLNLDLIVKTADRNYSSSI